MAEFLDGKDADNEFSSERTMGKGIWATRPWWRSWPQAGGQRPIEVCSALVRLGLWSWGTWMQCLDGWYLLGAAQPSVRLLFPVLAWVLGGPVPRGSGRLAAVAWKTSPRSESKWQHRHFLLCQYETGPSARVPPPILGRKAGPRLNQGLVSLDSNFLPGPPSSQEDRSSNTYSLQGKPFSRG